MKGTKLKFLESYRTVLNWVLVSPPRNLTAKVARVHDPIPWLKIISRVKKMFLLTTLARLGCSRNPGYATGKERRRV